jgi:hypothetical protein
MDTQQTVRDERAIRSAASPGRPDSSMRAPAQATALCRHCEYNPVSGRIFGYCSWDCHDADDDAGEGEDEQAA